MARTRTAQQRSRLAYARLHCVTSSNSWLRKWMASLKTIISSSRRSKITVANITRHAAPRVKSCTRSSTPSLLLDCSRLHGPWLPRWYEQAQRQHEALLLAGSITAQQLCVIIPTPATTAGSKPVASILGDTPSVASAALGAAGSDASVANDVAPTHASLSSTAKVLAPSVALRFLGAHAPYVQSAQAAACATRTAQFPPFEAFITHKNSSSIEQPSVLPMQLFVHSVFQQASLSVEVRPNSTLAGLSAVVAAALKERHPTLARLPQLVPSGMNFHRASHRLVGADTRMCSEAGLTHGDTLQLSVEGVGSICGGSAAVAAADMSSSETISFVSSLKNELAKFVRNPKLTTWTQSDQINQEQKWFEREFSFPMWLAPLWRDECCSRLNHFSGYGCTRFLRNESCKRLGGEDYVHCCMLCGQRGHGAFMFDPSTGSWKCPVRSKLAESAVRLPSTMQQRLRHLVAQNDNTYRTSSNAAHEVVDEMLNGLVTALCLRGGGSAAAASSDLQIHNEHARSAASPTKLAPWAPIAPLRSYQPVQVTRPPIYSHQEYPSLVPKISSTAGLVIASTISVAPLQTTTSATIPLQMRSVSEPVVTVAATPGSTVEDIERIHLPLPKSAPSHTLLEQTQPGLPQTSVLQPADTSAASTVTSSESSSTGARAPGPTCIVHEFDVDEGLLGKTTLLARMMMNTVTNSLEFSEVYLSHTSAQVFNAQLRREGGVTKDVVVKCFVSNLSEHQKQRDEIKTEVGIIQKLNPLYVVKVLHLKELVILGVPRFCFIMERMAMNLDTFVCGPVDGKVRKFTAHQVRDLAVQLLEAYQHLHENDVTHRDPKPENVLCTLGGPAPALRLCDFSFSKDDTGSSRMQATHVGTVDVSRLRCWLSPEMAFKMSYKPSTDAWSVGCVLYFLATQGKVPFHTEQAVLTLRVMTNIGMKSKADDDLKQALAEHGLQDSAPLHHDLITRLLRVDPEERLKLKGPIKSAQPINQLVAASIATPRAPGGPPITSLTNEQLFELHRRPPAALMHPACWSDARVLRFLVSMSVQLENSPSSRAVQHLQEQLDTRDDIHQLTLNWKSNERLLPFWREFMKASSIQLWQGPVQLLHCIRRVALRLNTEHDSSVHSKHSWQELQDDFTQLVAQQFPKFIVQLWLLGHELGTFRSTIEAERAGLPEFEMLSDSTMDHTHPHLIPASFTPAARDTRMLLHHAVQTNTPDYIAHYKQLLNYQGLSANSGASLSVVSPVRSMDVAASQTVSVSDSAALVPSDVSLLFDISRRSGRVMRLQPAVCAALNSAIPSNVISELTVANGSHVAQAQIWIRCSAAEHVESVTAAVLGALRLLFSRHPSVQSTRHLPTFLLVDVDPHAGAFVEIQMPQQPMCVTDATLQPPLVHTLQTQARNNGHPHELGHFSFIADMGDALAKTLPGVRHLIVTNLHLVFPEVTALHTPSEQWNTTPVYAAMWDPQPLAASLHRKAAHCQRPRLLLAGGTEPTRICQIVSNFVAGDRQLDVAVLAIPINSPVHMNDWTTWNGTAADARENIHDSMEDKAEYVIADLPRRSEAYIRGTLVRRVEALHGVGPRLVIDLPDDASKTIQGDCGRVLFRCERQQPIHRTPLGIHKALLGNKYAWSIPLDDTLEWLNHKFDLEKDHRWTLYWRMLGLQ
jgi:serine/threonine protein kinase